MATPIAAGSHVLPRGRFMAPVAGLRPIVGRIGATAALGDTTVLWEDGTRITFPTAEFDATLYQIVQPDAATLGLLSSVVQSAMFNVGSRARGPCSLAVGVADAAGTVVAQLVGFESPLGYILVPADQVTVVPNA